jgi:flavin reductase
VTRGERGPKAEEERGVTDPVSPERFRSVLGRFVTGISIMTAVGSDGEPHGMTANALASVSLDPPLVLVCVDRSAIMAELMEDADGFALSFLTREQEELSTWFATPERPTGAAQFDGLVTSALVTGSPILEDSLAWLDCRRWAIYDGGDHIIVVGEVVALGETEDLQAAPLLYDRGRYAGVGESPTTTPRWKAADRDA